MSNNLFLLINKTALRHPTIYYVTNIMEMLNRNSAVHGPTSTANGKSNHEQRGNSCIRAL